MKKRLSIISLIIALAGVWSLLAFVKAETAVAAPITQPLFPDQRDAVVQAVNWLIATHQNEDGGYASFSGGANLAPSDVGGTVDAILAISSVGYNPIPSLDYLRQNSADAAAYAQTDGSTAGKLILALAAAGQNPRSFAGQDFVAILSAHLQPDGDYNVPQPFGHSLALLALAAVNEPIPPEAVAWLTALQAADEGLDGSWDDGFGTAGNADATAMAVMALLAAGVPADDAVLTRAVDFLAQTQLDGGGWEYGPGFGQNGNSTALVVQALSALGLDFYSADSAFAKDGQSPLTALLSYQGESGAFQADFGEGPFDDFFTTVQAIPAAAGKAFPLNGRYEAARQAGSCLLTLQDEATGGWEQFATFGVDAAGTARAMQAIAALGDDPAFALPALESLTPDYLAVSRGGGIGIVMQGVAAAGGDVYDFAGVDLVEQMTAVLSDTGEYDSTQFGPFSHAEAMLGLLAVGEAVDETAVSFLLNSHANGDWGGPDSSGIALNVLGKLGQPLFEAIDNLRATQLPDGGWGFDGSNPSSSSEVVQGLVAAGENPFGPDWSQVVSGTIVNAADAVIALQGENGCWPNLYGPGDDPFGTTDGIILLTQAVGPVGPVPMLLAAPTEAEAPPAEPVIEPTVEQAAPTLAPAPEPTDAPPTAVPEPTAAPPVEEAPAATAQPAVEPAPAQPSSVAPAIAVVVALLLLGGGAYWYLKK